MDSDFLYKEETDQIIGSAFSVLNSLGHGLHEKPYENALAVEFRHRNISFDQQRRFPVHYRGVRVSEYVPDLIAFDKIIIDTKVIRRIGDHEIGQMLNYLRISGMKVGLIINFSNAKLDFRRVSASHQPFVRSKGV